MDGQISEQAAAADLALYPGPGPDGRLALRLVHGVALVYIAWLAVAFSLVAADRGDSAQHLEPHVGAVLVGTFALVLVFTRREWLSRMEGRLESSAASSPNGVFPVVLVLASIVPAEAPAGLHALLQVVMIATGLAYFLPIWSADSAKRAARPLLWLAAVSEGLLVIGFALAGEPTELRGSTIYGAIVVWVYTALGWLMPRGSRWWWWREPSAGRV
ncbi:hypothetical protein [Engelhardtia mirabilis]|uniref:Uncharacterized protein n=1 Tax=Engelhardtia mirabilis TaxID=2528011 RepID=A0A518BPR0_9BACT|nr:hypothetical protein Pla133_40610 [Planctomycetes bacterium Pla133]QDV03273.1 hypothetical protein Pla86_40600 [Planctomycetes bacterium Pla86]